MVSYEMYNFESEELVKYIGTLHINKNLTYEEIESIIDDFIKDNFEELYEELLEIVMVNTETQIMDYIFSLLKNHGEFDDFNDPWPYLHDLDITHGGLFLDAYFITYGKHLDAYDY